MYVCVSLFYYLFYTCFFFFLITACEYDRLMLILMSLRVTNSAFDYYVLILPMLLLYEFNYLFIYSALSRTGVSFVCFKWHFCKIKCGLTISDELCVKLCVETMQSFTSY